MYWTLEQCIEMLKTISDNLKINMWGLICKMIMQEIELAEMNLKM
jgi:hypothetical protein